MIRIFFSTFQRCRNLRELHFSRPYAKFNSPCVMQACDEYIQAVKGKTCFMLSEKLLIIYGLDCIIEDFSISLHPLT